METVTMIREALAGILAAAGLPMPTGDSFFVDWNTGTDAAGKGIRHDDPLKTLQFALGQGLANKGNVFLLMPGHIETVDAIADIDANLAGALIVALGNGEDRAKFTFNTVVGASINVTQPNITFVNVHFFNSVDAAVGPLDVDATDCSFINCLFEDDGVQNTLTWIKQDNAAHRLLVKNPRNLGATGLGNNSFIEIGSGRGTRVLNLVSRGYFADGNIKFTAAAIDFLVEDCKLTNWNTTSNKNIVGFALMTGDFNNNRCRNDTDADVGWINTPAAASLFENYGVNADGETGILIGTPSA